MTTTTTTTTVDNTTPTGARRGTGGPLSARRRPLLPAELDALLRQMIVSSPTQRLNHTVLSRTPTSGS
jgi:hypothetical protein